MTTLPDQNLYQTDFALWVENTVNKLKHQDHSHIDWENVTEEIEALGVRDKRELESRLTTLFENLLKRRYVKLPQCYRPWEVNISRTQQALKRIFRDSPSLRDYYLTISDECYQNAVENIKKEFDTQFPENGHFPKDIDTLLIDNFDYF